jgi:hypothetical protein
VADKEHPTVLSGCIEDTDEGVEATRHEGHNVDVRHLRPLDPAAVCQGAGRGPRPKDQFPSVARQELQQLSQGRMDPLPRWPVRDRKVEYKVASPVVERVLPQHAIVSGVHRRGHSVEVDGRNARLNSMLVQGLPETTVCHTGRSGSSGYLEG